MCGVGGCVSDKQGDEEVDKTVGEIRIRRIRKQVGRVGMSYERIIIINKKKILALHTMKRYP